MDMFVLKAHLRPPMFTQCVVDLRLAYSAYDNTYIYLFIFVCTYICVYLQTRIYSEKLSVNQAGKYSTCSRYVTIRKQRENGQSIGGRPTSTDLQRTGMVYTLVSWYSPRRCTTTSLRPVRYSSKFIVNFRFRLTTVSRKFRINFLFPVRQFIEGWTDRCSPSHILDFDINFYFPLSISRLRH